MSDTVERRPGLLPDVVLAQMAAGQTALESRGSEVDYLQQNFELPGAATPCRCIRATGSEVGRVRGHSQAPGMQVWAALTWGAAQDAGEVSAHGSA